MRNTNEGAHPAARKVISWSLISSSVNGESLVTNDSISISFVSPVLSLRAPYALLVYLFVPLSLRFHIPASFL